MELLFRDGVRAASRRDDGVQARARYGEALRAWAAASVSNRSPADGSRSRARAPGSLEGPLANRPNFKARIWMAWWLCGVG